MKQLTAEQRVKADARKAQFKTLIKNVGDMSAVQRAELSAKMGVILTADGRALSLHNTCLLALQCPQATIVGGFKQWLKHGRAVRKGEHGHMIWFPRTGGKKNEADAPNTGEAVEKAEIRFMIGTVFDISQTMEIENTHSEPLPTQPAQPQSLALVPVNREEPHPQPDRHWTAKIIDLELVS